MILTDIDDGSVHQSDKNSTWQIFFTRKKSLYSQCCNCSIQTYLPSKQTPWPESVSELYRLSDCRLSEKLVSTFADGGVSRSQHGRSPTAIILVF
jgi:hypothetical protein